MQNTLVLVTGATGFLGSYVVRLLVQQGWRVRALRRAGSRMELVQACTDQVDWVEADLTDLVAMEDALQGVTHVCHCGAMVSFHPRDRQRMLRVNVEGTANLVNLSLEQGVRHFLHVSSIATIGRHKENLTLHEGIKWQNSDPHSAYALSKYQAEQEAWRGHFEGMPTAIVNPAIILGAGYWGMGSGRFFQKISSGLPFYPTGRAAFVDVRDVALFLLRLLEQGTADERYILAADNLPYRTFFEEVAGALGKKPPTLRLPPWMTQVAWRLEWLREKLTGQAPIITRDSARSSVSPYTYDASKSRTVAGFSYRPLAQTVRETAAAFLEAQALGRDWGVLPMLPDAAPSTG